LGAFGGDSPDIEEQTPGDSFIGIYDRGDLLTAGMLDMHLGRGEWVWLDPADADDISGAVSSEKYSLVMEADGLNYTITMSGSDAMRLHLGAYNNLIKLSYQAAMLDSKGLGPSEIESVLGAVPIPAVISVGRDLTETFFLGYIMLFVMYMAILSYGQYVMTSVITEKTSKTVELLVTAVKPVYLIFGKVLGAGLAGLVQLSVLLSIGAFSLGMWQNASDLFPPIISEAFNLSFPAITLFYALIFFLLGFFSFAFLYAAFASTVNRIEDSNSVVMLPMLLFITAFFVAMSGMTNPTAAYIVVCSFIPLLSPMIMFMRICVTDVPVYQILAAVAVNIATLIGVGIFSAKLYRVGVLMYGMKPSLRNIWRSFCGRR
jgi:ABC-2 type transport system permease protein